MATYVDTATLEVIAEKFARACQPCPFSGRVTSNEVKIAIAEVFDVWPDVVAADVDARQ